MKVLVLFLASLCASFVCAEVNYNFPARNYVSVEGEWRIFYEADMSAHNPGLARDAIGKLQRTLSYVEQSLPVHAIEKLKSVRIFLMWGEAAPLGGHGSGMRYVRHGEPMNRANYDRRWGHSVVIYSAENLLYLSDLWARKAIAHELAHAWHIMNWPDNYPDIVSPWEQAKSRGLYANINDFRGRTIPEAYALKNNLEYFAELSAMYFVGGDYFPYSRERLAYYDSAGVAMVKDLWSID